MTEKPGKLRVKGIETEEVQAFLTQHPFLKPVLQEAEARVTEFFGDEVELVFQVAHDSEFSSWFRLLCGISVDLVFDEAMDKFEQFDEHWQLGLPYDIRHALHFYVRPKKY